MRLTIRTKSALLLVSYVLLLVMLFGGFSYAMVRGVRAQAIERFRQTATLVAAELDAALGAGARRLEHVGRLPGLAYGLERLRDAGRERQIPAWTTLHYLFFQSATFDGGVFLADRDGQILWAEPPESSLLGVDVAQSPVLEEARLRLTTVVSDGLPADALYDKAHVLVVYPIREEEEGGLAGYLGGIVDLEGPLFRQVLGAAGSTQGDFVAVTDRAGQVVAGSGARTSLLGSWLEPRAASDGVFAQVPMETAAWSVRAGDLDGVVLAEARKLQGLLVLSGAGILILALAGAAPVVRDLTGAVVALTKHAETMAKGDLSQPVCLPPRRDELGFLGEAFERMRAEVAGSQAALRQRLTERDDLLRLKEEFLANTTHELRTPLNVIFGYTEILEDGEDRSERREILEGVRTQAQKLLDLITDLMTVSGANAGRIYLKPSWVDLPRMAARLEVLAEKLVRSQGKKISLGWNVQEGLPTLWTDELRLEQALANLVTNAVKFTEQGTIELEIRHIPAQQEIYFTLRDTGIGIADQDLPFIFDEFRQVDGSMSSLYGGIGLGLAVVRKLVNLLGGQVQVASERGVGSIFLVTLAEQAPSILLEDVAQGGPPPGVG